MIWYKTIEELDELNRQTKVLYVSGRKINSLEFLLKFNHLKELYLHTFKLDSLNSLSELKSLNKLVMENVGSGCNLEPIGRLENLRELILQTPPGWD